MEAQPHRTGPLARYRVLDFGWVLAGAIPGMVLADLGAEVIKVETRERLDYMRQGRPIIGDRPDPEQSPMFHNVNRGKLSITLNIVRPEAADLARKLAASCDVVIENFSPGVMDKLGLGYEELRRVAPDVVMASISSTGQTGSLRDLRAYAPSIGALSGLDSTWGTMGVRPWGSSTPTQTCVVRCTPSSPSSPPCTAGGAPARASTSTSPCCGPPWLLWGLV